MVKDLNGKNDTEKARFLYSECRKIEHGAAALYAQANCISAMGLDDLTLLHAYKLALFKDKEFENVDLNQLENPDAARKVET